MLQVKLLEMPLTELEQNINAELDDNPALESASADDALDFEGADGGDTTGDSSEQEDGETSEYEREEREDALDAAFDNIGRDDEMPEVGGNRNYQNADYEETVYGDTTSFYDTLKEQMDMQHLTEKQHDMMEYIIGSLDDDGLLRKDLDSISDELAVYHNIDASTDELEEVLHRLQEFDPAGVGARNLQECLLLQIARRPDDKLRRAMEEVITNYFDAFTKKHWDKIQAGLQLSDTQTETLQNELRRLNPKPGASLGETIGRNLQQITPDFIVDTNEDGSVSFSLNRGNMPELHVSPSFTEMLENYKNDKHPADRQTKEALVYAREKVEKAQSYIEAIRQRRLTLYATMKAIIEIQHKFFADGDEADLKPMILKDVADRTGLDISTISRVSNVKYAQTKWGTFPLRFFFSDGYTTENGEEMSTRKIKLALKDLIGKENKKKPMSDDTLAEEMKKLGYPIARRTVAKYREQQGIPVARLRKE